MHHDVDLTKCPLSSSFSDSISVEWLLLVDLQVEIGNAVFINAGVYYNYVIVFSFFEKLWPSLLYNKKIGVCKAKSIDILLC